MEIFQYYMLFIAALRLFGVFNAWVTPRRIKTNVYSSRPDQVTDLQSRLFGWWTMMSMVICLATAYNPTNITLLYVAWVSFAIAWLHFVTELFIFKTSPFKDAITPFIVSSSSMIYIGSILYQ